MSPSFSGLLLRSASETGVLQVFRSISSPTRLWSFRRRHRHQDRSINASSASLWSLDRCCHRLAAQSCFGRSIRGSILLRTVDSSSNPSSPRHSQAFCRSTSKNFKFSRLLQPPIGRNVSVIHLFAGFSLRFSLASASIGSIPSRVCVNWFRFRLASASLHFDLSFGFTSLASSILSIFPSSADRRSICQSICPPCGHRSLRAVFQVFELLRRVTSLAEFRVVRLFAVPFN